ncbi:B-cell lymphoma/leukemia 11A [Balamuthia mandrillaris]
MEPPPLSAAVPGTHTLVPLSLILFAPPREEDQQFRKESSQPHSSSPSRNNDKNSSPTKRKRTASCFSEDYGDNEDEVENKIQRKRLEAIKTLITGHDEQLRLLERRVEDRVKRQLQRTEKTIAEKLELVFQVSQQRNKEENEEVFKLRQEKKDLWDRLRNERAAYKKLYEKNSQTNKQLREANRLAKKTGRRSEDLEKQANEAMERIEKLETENKQLKQQKEELESRLEEETALLIDKVEYLESKLQRMTMTEENDIPVEDDRQEREWNESELERQVSSQTLSAPSQEIMQLMQYLSSDETVDTAGIHTPSFSLPSTADGQNSSQFSFEREQLAGEDEEEGVDDDDEEAEDEEEEEEEEDEEEEGSQENILWRLGNPRQLLKSDLIYDFFEHAC